jgi:hypothetical protein
MAAIAAGNCRRGRDATIHCHATTVAHCRIEPYLDQAAPLRGAGSGAPRAGLCLGRPARRARAVPTERCIDLAGSFVMHSGTADQPSSSARNCPARGCRANGALRASHSTGLRPTITRRPLTWVQRLFGKRGKPGTFTSPVERAFHLCLGQDCSLQSFTVPTASTTRAGTKNSPMCKIPPAMPAIRTSTPTTPATLFSGAGANAAAAASGAGAMASSSDHHVTARGSALLSAEMVISCAAPARSSAPRRHAQLGGAGTGGGLAGVDVPGAEEVSTGAFCMVMARSWRTNPIVANIAPTRLPGSPDLEHRPDRPRRNSPAANSPSCCQGGRRQPTPGDASETGVEVAARDGRPWTACHCYRSDGAARPPRPRDSA